MQIRGLVIVVWLFCATKTQPTEPDTNRMMDSELKSRLARQSRKRKTQTENTHMATKKKKKTEPANEPTPQDPPADKNPKRLKQSEIPGTERPRIREIDDAAEAYVAVRNERQELTKQEVAKKKILSDLMHKHADAIGRDEVGGVTYRYDGDMLVILKPAGEELKVKHVDPDDPEPEPKPIVVGTAPADITEGQT